MLRWVESFLLLCVCSFACFAIANPLQLWEISVSPKENVLQKLQTDGLLDVWSAKNLKTQVVVEESAAQKLRTRLDDLHVDHKILEKDFSRLVEEERLYMEKRRRNKRSIERMDWHSYHRLQDIEGYLGWLNATNPGKVTVGSVAVTEEGNHVYVVRVTDPSTSGPKIKIWIEGGIHAREWISPATTTYLLQQVVSNKDFKEILQHSEWFFVPVANPDGYEYTFSGSSRARMWRKNRSSNRNRNRFFSFGSACLGTDLNRNWDEHWSVGASDDPCDETYMGPFPFSAPETEGLRRLMERENKKDPINLFITFHSYGQAVLYPYGWSNKPPPNVRELHELGKRFVDAVKYASNFKTDYTLGGSGPVYGLASGASDDWAYGQGINSSYTIELRDTGHYGFHLPENQIMETVKETSAGVYCMASYLTNIGPCSRVQRRRYDIEPRRFRPPKRRRNRIITFE